MNNVKIAYICNGLDPKCSGKVGCFKCLRPNFDEAIRCTHTLNPEYAINPPCEDPERYVPERFKKYVVGDEIRYFEDYN